MGGLRGDEGRAGRLRAKSGPSMADGHRRVSTQNCRTRIALGISCDGPLRPHIPTIRKDCNGWELAVPDDPNRKGSCAR